MVRRPRKLSTPKQALLGEYHSVLAEIADLLEAARRASARSVNIVMTRTYWEIGRRIVEFEQAGEKRAEYGSELVKRLSVDLTARFGRGFSRNNLQYMRVFYQQRQICQTVSGKSSTPQEHAIASQKCQTASGKSDSTAPSFPLPWSHYVRLLSIKNENARSFYEHEAVRGGWSIRQLSRQIDSQFYERTALSKNKLAMLTKAQSSSEEEMLTPEQEIKDPYVLEFLDLRDEYSESDFEQALTTKLESFLLELGGDFTFVGRQRRLRIDDEWYRIDLLFFHRRLRCLIVIDLKLGKFSHADAGQMHLYLNYAKDHWMLPNENPPVGLILCASKSNTLVKYALEGLPNKVLAAEYRTALPDEKAIAAEVDTARKRLESRK